MNKKILLVCHFILITPLLYAFFYAYHHSEFFKPLLHFFGDIAIGLLFIIISLSIGINLFKKFFHNKSHWNQILALIGHYILFYVFLHLILYLFTEIFWQEFFSEIFKRSYLLIGFSALILLIILDFFSFYQKKIFYKISSLSYLAGLLSSIHFLLGQKIPSLLSYILFLLFLLLICFRLLRKDKK